MTTLRRDLERAARQRGHDAPQRLTDHELSWWLYDHPATEPESIDLSGLAEKPKRGKR